MLFFEIIRQIDYIANKKTYENNVTKEVLEKKFE